MPRRNLNTAVSIFNFPPVPAVTKPPEWHAQAVQEMGAEGMLGSHLHNIHPKILAAGGLLKAMVNRGLVSRVHESWRSKKIYNLPGHYRAVAKEQGHKAALRSTIQEGILIGTLPHISDSLGKLNRMQRQTNKRASVIVHPEAIVHPRDQLLGGRRLKKSADFMRFKDKFAGGLHYQLTAEVLQSWGIPLDADPEEMSRLMQQKEAELGLSTPVLDLGFIGKERGGQRIAYPTSLIRTLAEQNRIAWVQLGWRPDLCESPADAARERTQLRQAVNGDLAGTEQGAWLSLISDAMPNRGTLSLDVEVAEATLLAAGARNFIDGNRQIIESARTLV
jgi:hypothetical protein